MKEFGSDFHYVHILNGADNTIGTYYPRALYYADGRQAIIDLYRTIGFNRLWVPNYFCFDVLKSLETHGLNLQYYCDLPSLDERSSLLNLPYEEGDALLRINFFGLRTRRSNSGIPVPVIEDHTHDLIGDWAVNSDADWCIASLRKTLPIAEGGILWSPKGLEMGECPKLTEENQRLALKRWDAMKKKALYLEDKIGDKNAFREDMVYTEELFDSMDVSALDDETLGFLAEFDVKSWYIKKQENREILKESKDCRFEVLEPEESGCNPFSYTVLFNSNIDRDAYRQYLIDNSVYPAILWVVPDKSSPMVKDFSQRILSIHCDARYDSHDMIQLSGILSGN